MKTTIDNVTVITNNIPRATINWWDLTDIEKKEFDHLRTEDDQYSAIFVRYRDSVYNVADFMLINNMESFKGWDGYASDSYFSGTLVKFVEDGNIDYVIMGRYYS